jgi:hypothetical protein
VGGWRKLHNEELNKVYPSPDIYREKKSKSMRWQELVACIEETYTKEGRKERRKPFGRFGCRRGDNIRMDLDVLTALIWLKKLTSAGSCEQDNKKAINFLTN